MPFRKEPSFYFQSRKEKPVSRVKPEILSHCLGLAFSVTAQHSVLCHCKTWLVFVVGFLFLFFVSMAKWSGYFWKWGIGFSLPWEISHYTKFRSSSYDLCVPYGFESCKSCSPLVWCIHQPSGWLHNFLDLVQKVLCFIVPMVSTVLLLCNLHLHLCMSKLLAGSLKQTQQNHLEMLHTAQNEVLTSFLPSEEIAHLYLVRVWGLCAPQRQKPCLCFKNIRDCTSICVPFLPTDVDCSIRFCLLLSSAPWVFLQHCLVNIWLF